MVKDDLDQGRLSAALIAPKPCCRLFTSCGQSRAEEAYDSSKTKYRYTVHRLEVSGRGFFVSSRLMVNTT